MAFKKMKRNSYNDSSHHSKQNYNPNFDLALQNIIQDVRTIWETPQHFYYTDHGPRHSETIIERLSLVFKGQRKKLSDLEWFLLKAAAYLHDIGMQCMDRTLLISVADLPRDFTIPLPPDLLEKIRETHNLLSYHQIMNVKTSAGATQNPLLHRALIGLSAEMIEAIALLSKGHKDCPDDPRLDSLGNTIPGGPVNLRLLCTLLRFGDTLDADSSRLGASGMERFIAMSDSLPPERQIHIWKHYFVSSVVITEGLVQLHYKIPEQYKGLTDLFIRLAEEPLLKHKEALLELWKTEGLHLQIVSIKPKIYLQLCQYQISDDTLEYLKKWGEEQKNIDLQAALQGTTIKDSHEEVKEGTKTDPQTKERIKKEIIRILEYRQLKPLYEALRESIIDDDKEHKRKMTHTITTILDLAEILTNDEVLHVLLILDKATKKCLDKIEKEEGNQTLKKKIWDGAVDILGWLVLLSVNYKWANPTKDSLNDRVTPIKLVIPVKTEAGVEIAYSSLTDSQAKLEVDKSGGIHAFGRDRIGCLRPEVGWDSKDAFLSIVELIWRKIHNEAPPELTDDALIRLNTTIEIRNEKKEHYYLSVDEKDKKISTMGEKEYMRLKAALPALPILFMTTGIRKSENVFIIMEPKLEAQLIEFFRNKECI